MKNLLSPFSPSEELAGMAIPTGPNRFHLDRRLAYKAMILHMIVPKLVFAPLTSTEPTCTRMFLHRIISRPAYSFVSGHMSPCN